MKRRRTFIRLAYHSKHNTTTSCVYVLLIVLWNGYNLMRATRLTCLLFLGFQVFLEDTHKQTQTRRLSEKKREKSEREQKSWWWDEIIWPNWIKSDNISLSVSLLKHFIVHIILILLLKNFNRRRRRRKNKRERKREKEVFIGVLVFHVVV